MTLRVLVCGGRDFSDRRAVFSALDALREKHGDLFIIHGAARGADSLAGEWALERGQHGVACPANWTRDGRAAGPLRNARMLTHSPNLVLAFPGGRGTADMVSRAVRAGIPVETNPGTPGEHSWKVETWLRTAE